jgi:hypothetical protein
MATFVKPCSLSRIFGTTWIFFTVLMLGACMDADPTRLPYCQDHLAAGDLGAFADEGNGLVSNPEIEPWVYRCAAGQRFVNGGCRGEVQRLTFIEARQYAEAVSESSKGRWRLPTAEEMRAVRQRDCVFPAYNPTVFPDLPVENFWTSTLLAMSSSYGCIVYSYQGSRSCRAFLDARHPFLLVKDPGG